MTGRHIVMATVGSQGDLFPFLAVGRELRQRGYRVTIGAHGIHRDAVAAAGLDYILASGIAEPEDKAAFAARDITLDTTAPDAGGLPTVSGADTTRNRTVPSIRNRRASSV